MSQTTAPPKWQHALQSAIDKAGGPSALMRLLNERGHDVSSHGVIWYWTKNGVPAKYCPDIEALTGVPCEELCPDVKWGLVRNADKQSAQA